jgi:7,8-dihydropterin-6-yl-methyl-4-(beta-D-ribofuranosyl)aminobenzene 5'-phosphate synthase
MDNTTDFLLTDSGHATRPSFIQNEKFVLPSPVAEHGFSALITIPKCEQGASTSFLFDTGVSENGVIHNADIFGIDFGRIDGIILSHGHFDHFQVLLIF